jgi:uncharacterized membrane protein YkoI
MRALLLAALLAILFALAPTVVPADDDHDRAREAVAAGRILPLTKIIERATAQFGGTVLDAEYEGGDDEGDDHHGEWPPRSDYRIKLLTADGRVLMLEYDAVTGELISQHGRHRTRHRGGHGDSKDD